MCGFAGIINKTGRKVSAGVLREMADTMNHRGPDAEGVYLREQIGFHHKRLSIIDLDSGQQPMSFDGITLVFNGEIYNYIELREELKAAGRHFETLSDTEVIIRLYQEHGKECCRMLNGMFAFMLHDARKNVVFIARDHFGIKPLYWWEDGERLLFASEIKAILAHPEVEARAHLPALREYLTFQFILGEETMFQHIHKVKPGCSAELDLQDYRWTEHCYWEPDFRLDPYHNESYFVDELRLLLEDTVRIQLRSDVPLGAYLSGGMDSSAVTLLAARMHEGPLKTFTGAFREGPAFDESRYARLVAQEAGAEFHLVHPGEDDFIELLPTLIHHLDEPVAGPGLFPQYMVSRLASEHVKVCLGGQGGDEIFGGYTRYLVAYLEQAIKGAILNSNEEGEHIVSLKSILPNLHALKEYIPMMKKFWKEDAFEGMDRRYFNLINRMGQSARYLDRDFLGVDHERRAFERFSELFNHSDTLSYYNKMTHFDMFGSLPALLQVEDRVSMAASMESRVPLLDRRIVDLVSQMPAGMKFRGGEMKYLFRKAIGDVLPAPILERKDKMGFPVPLHLWLKGKTGDFVRDILTSEKCRNRGIFQTGEVEALLDAEAPFGRQLWGFLCLELWFINFIDN